MCLCVLLVFNVMFDGVLLLCVFACVLGVVCLLNVFLCFVCKRTEWCFMVWLLCYCLCMCLSVV